MVETGLKEWLDRDEPPTDFYVLIGQPRLCANRELLLARLEDASEYLFQVQNHKDPKTRDRARKYHRLVAEARRTISDEARWEKYDQDLIAKIHKLYKKNPDFSGPQPKLDNLRRWLALVQKVDDGRIDELIRAWTAKTKKPQPAAEMETQSNHAVNQTEQVSLPNSDSESDIYGLAHIEDAKPKNKSTSERSEARGDRPGPPPPPGRAGGKAPPPPPPRTLSAPASETRGEPAQPPQITPVNLQSSVLDGLRGQPSGSGNLTALWIVLAAFLTAVVLGIFGLMIAWASGAFDRGRSERSTPTSRFVRSADSKDSVSEVGCHAKWNIDELS